MSKLNVSFIAEFVTQNNNVDLYDKKIDQKVDNGPMTEILENLEYMADTANIDVCAQYEIIDSALSHIYVLTYDGDDICVHLSQSEELVSIPDSDQINDRISDLERELEDAKDLELYLQNEYMIKGTQLSDTLWKINEKKREEEREQKRHDMSIKSFRSYRTQSYNSIKTDISNGKMKEEEIHPQYEDIHMICEALDDIGALYKKESETMFWDLFKDIVQEEVHSTQYSDIFT